MVLQVPALFCVFFCIEFKRLKRLRTQPMDYIFFLISCCGWWQNYSQGRPLKTSSEDFLIPQVFEHVSSTLETLLSDKITFDFAKG